MSECADCGGDFRRTALTARGGTFVCGACARDRDVELGGGVVVSGGLGRPAILSERAAALDAAVLHHVERGWLLLDREPNRAVISHHKSVNHHMQLVRSVLTLGLWLIAWIVLVLLGRHERAEPVVSDKAGVNLRWPAGLVSEP